MGDRVLRHPSGVLELRAGRRWFDTATFRPPAELGELVEHFWMVRWDVRGHEPHTQHTLSNSSVHLCFEAGRSRIQGVVTGRFTRLLEGRGRVFGVKFRPAGFRPFLGSPVSAVTDGTLPVSSVFGPDGDALVTRMLAIDTPPLDLPGGQGGQVLFLEGDEMAEVAGAFLSERRPAPDPITAEINRIVALIVADRSIIRVEQVADRAGMGRRTLQRLFHEHVGVSPKWVIQRYRLHEAAERLADGGGVSLAALALELGYFDQAHFARDFRAIVGQPPAEYARRAGPGPAP
jgi:AraC-like DNA-binding protein